MFSATVSRKRLSPELIPITLLALAAVTAFGLRFLPAEDGPVAQATKATREDWFRPETDAQVLKRALDEDHVSDRWIYQDLNAARAQAQKTGKPVLAVFRCVPCGAAPELDGAVCTLGGKDAAEFEAHIRAAGGELGHLLDQFVCVRIVKMNGVNRNVFRFDRDVPYVAMCLNADGVVYGRYGTRVSKDRRNLPRHKLASFQKSLKRALELHGAYPQNRAELASKRQDDPAPSLAEEMKTFEPFPPEHNPTEVKNCIHCHTVGEAEVRRVLADGQLTKRDLWPFPLPENIGLKLEVDDGLVVSSVLNDSAAEKAGLRKGDLLLRLAQQPLISEADVQWALHFAPDEGKLPIAVRRGEQTVTTTLSLNGDWRKSDGHWRASLGPLRPDVHLRPEPYRVKKGAEPGQMGLGIYYPRGPAAKAGLRNGDLLVAVDGRSDLHWEADFLKYIHLDRPNAKTVDLTIIRQGVKSTLTVPIR